MNTKTLFAAAVAAIGAITLLGNGSAFASEVSLDFTAATTSTLTRAEVRAEVVQARAAGLIAHGERNTVIADSGPTLTRAQVKAETLEAIRLGAISRHERSSTMTAAQLENIRSAGSKAIDMTMASR